MEDSESKSGYYSSYAEFSKTLRTWFVAFGIGGPVVLLANEKAWPKIIASKCSFDLALLFLIGGGIQVISSFANKHSMWHLYFGDEKMEEAETDAKIKEKIGQHRSTSIYKVARWYSYQNWIDELLDFFTLCLFAWATYLAFIILSAPYEGSIIRDDSRSHCAWITGTIIAFIISLVWGAISLWPKK
jgi:hypothetical protein